MICSNKHCLWNAFDTCCHESEEAYDKATPNQLDCPVSLRKDHQESMFMIIDEVNEMMMKRNLGELAAIYRFVEGQRENPRATKIADKRKQLTTEQKRKAIQAGGSIKTNHHIDTESMLRELKGK